MAPDDSALLVADHLGKTYGDGVPFRALDDVCFSIGHGEFMSVTGQSGSGKSTLLNLLGLLDTPTDGTVHINAQDAATMSKDERAELRNRLIGFVFQFHYLLPEFTVLENALMPAFISADRDERESRDAALETLSFVGLADLADRGAGELSGGQKQRVALARALVNRPLLLLADEPTGNLDTTNGRAVYDLFARINAEWGTTVVVVTHDSRIAERTSRVLEICDGRLVSDMRGGLETLRHAGST